MLVGKGHLGGQLLGAKPGELVDIVGRMRLALCGHEPGEAEHAAAEVGIDICADPLERLHLEPRLLEELAAQTVERLLALLEEAAREIPESERRLDPAAPEQNLPVANEQPLDGGDRVGPVVGAAALAVQVAGRAGSSSPAPQRGQNRQPSRIGTLRRDGGAALVLELGQVALGIEGAHASGAGRGDGLPVDVILDVADREDTFDIRLQSSPAS